MLALCSVVTIIAGVGKDLEKIDQQPMCTLQQIKCSRR